MSANNIVYIKNLEVDGLVHSLWVVWEQSASMEPKIPDYIIRTNHNFYGLNEAVKEARRLTDNYVEYGINFLDKSK